MQWTKPGTRRACIISGLLAVLVGCSDSSDDKQLASKSTFDAAQLPAPAVAEVRKEPAQPALVVAQVPAEPVIGTVTPVPGTEPKPPVTTGGEATPVIDPKSQIVPLEPIKVGRFTEIAPDTIDGDTFVPSNLIDYDLGNLVSVASKDVHSIKDDNVFIAPVKGLIQYPLAPTKLLATPGRFPVIIFEHGMGEQEGYQGYDYLSEELASHGYVVVSINANKNNALGDPGSQSRAQLILGTLDRLRQIDKRGQIDDNGKPTQLDALQGKLDFTRIGIMGHSRGGQGVSNAIKFNQTRVGVREEDLKAAVLANTSFFEGNYPELVAAVIPAVKSAPVPPAGPVTQVQLVALFAKLTPEQLARVLAEPTATAAQVSQAAQKISQTPREQLTAQIFAKLTPEGHTDYAAKAMRLMLADLAEAKFQAAIKKYNIFYSAGRETAVPYDFRGAFMLAPTDFDGNLGLDNVPLANLLPTCDGDLSSMDGSRAYDHNRFAPKTDTAPRYQIVVKGANHDFYNRKWDFPDDVDGSGTGSDYCKLGRSNVRLSRDDQERNGLFLINSFMRYHVGGEQKFAAYWNGTAQLPEAACELGKKTCDERVVLTVQKSDSKRRLIQRFEQDNSLIQNELGGANAFSGFDTDGLARCAMSLGVSIDPGKCTPSQLPGFEYGRGGFLSLADHAELAWSQSDATIVTDLTGISAKGNDSLTFRIAVVRPMGQEVLVTLTDSSGKSATVTASDFSDALYNGPRPKGNGRPLADHPDDKIWSDKVPQLLNMVAIPLKAFEGIDTTSLKELKLVFPKESGKVAITDIELQNLGREKPDQAVAARQ